MIDFYLPQQLSAHEPAEARGLKRDGVRLIVSRTNEKLVTHARFYHLPDFLEAGDVVVVNNSATINAAFDGSYERADGDIESIRLHLSTPISNRRWVVELRRLADAGTGSAQTVPLLDANAGERIHLTAGGIVNLLAPYLRTGNQSAAERVRLWVAELDLPQPVLRYAADHGSPIRYDYVPRPWPLDYYQTVFAREPGSVEMPSAGRAFTQETVQQLIQKGVQIVPITLHTGVASLEADEPVYPERYRVSEAAAEAVNRARAQGSRVVAVGTTVVRALETVAAPDGEVHSDSGWTNLVITPERGLYAVDAMLTGLHAPKASHLAMLEAIAGRQHLNRVYKSALRRRYLWHEFGDLHLILPGRPLRPPIITTHRSYATC
jgi:S-adenosylmethionine:tRNA ribosyltransferase-isomerase